MLTVSIVVCNPEPEMLKTFLASLVKYTPEMSQCIICHNNLDGSDPAVLMELVSPFILEAVNLQIIHGTPGENIGFGAAHNANAKLATKSYLAILNDDIEFFEPWAGPMIKILAEDPKVAQVGMKQDTCSTWNRDGIGMPSNEEPEYIEASCLLMPTKLAQAYGPFDEAYKIGYWEDGNLSLRLRKDGYTITNIDLDWKHHRAKTSSRIKVDIEGYHVRNEQVFKERWGCYLHKRTFGKTIVVKRQGSIGDVFLITPILRSLRKRGPEDEILVMTSAPQMLLACSDLDGFIPWGRPYPCDELIDLDYAYEKDFRKHIITAYTEVAVIEPHYMRGILYVDKARMDKVKMLIKSVPRPFVVLELSDLSDKWPSKQWLHYDAVIPYLKEKGYTVVGIGLCDRQLKPIGIDINLMNMFDPLESAVILSESALFIGHEGLIAHVAQALSIPSIILYGPTSPEYTADLSLPSLMPVVSPVGCQGCRHVHNAGVGVLCPRENICMEAITPDMVIGAIEELIKKKVDKQ